MSDVVMDDPQEEVQDDNALIDLVGSIVTAAMTSKDRRVYRIMDFALATIAKEQVSLLPTLFVKYEALKAREDELEREAEEAYDNDAARKMRARIFKDQSA